MTEPTYDLIIRGGRVATTTDVFEADVAISGETIAAIGRGLPPAKREIDARGKLVLPGGVDSPVRAFKAVGATPIFIERGRGAYLEDADGHTYIDYVMSWGPLIHGHAPKGLVRALAGAAAATRKAARRNLVMGPSSPLMVNKCLR